MFVVPLEQALAGPLQTISDRDRNSPVYYLAFKLLVELPLLLNLCCSFFVPYTHNFFISLSHVLLLNLISSGVESRKGLNRASLVLMI